MAERKTLPTEIINAETHKEMLEAQGQIPALREKLFGLFSKSSHEEMSIPEGSIKSVRCVVEDEDGEEVNVLVTTDVPSELHLCIPDAMFDVNIENEQASFVLGKNAARVQVEESSRMARAREISRYGSIIRTMVPVEFELQQSEVISEK